MPPHFSAPSYATDNVSIYRNTKKNNIVSQYEMRIAIYRNFSIVVLSPRNALRRGYCNAAVVLSVSPSVRQCVRVSVTPYLVNTIET